MGDAVRRGLGTLLALVLGGLLGSAVAVLCTRLLAPRPPLSWLTRTWVLGVPPGTLDVRVMELTVGGAVHVGVLTAVGAIAAALLHARLR